MTKSSRFSSFSLCFFRVLTAASFVIGASLAYAQEEAETPTNAQNNAITEEHSTPVAPLPAEFSEEARIEYTEKLRTLRAQMNEKAWEDALKTAEELSTLRPREPQVRFIRTIALTELGRDDEAKADLLALISDFPELPEPRNNLAALYAKAGEYNLAQRELELAIAAVPDYSVAHANLADLYLQLALQHYQKAADTNKDASARRALTARLDSLRALITPPTKTEIQEAESNASRQENEEPTGSDAREKSEPENASPNIQ